MKRNFTFIAGTVAVLGLAGCAPKAVDLTPSASHGDIEFKAVSMKDTYRQGEPISILFQVKNTGTKEVPLFINFRGNFGVEFSRVLKNETQEFAEITHPPIEVNPELGPIPIVVDNSSFVLLQPGEEGRVYWDRDREFALKSGGKPANLPPGKYTYIAEYRVKTGYDGKYEDKGLPFEADGKAFFDRAPRGVWRSECTFIVSSEKVAPRSGRPPQGGRPRG